MNLAGLAFTDVVRCRVPWGVAIINPERAILFANERARSFFLAGAGIEERSGRLHFESPAADNAAGALIHNSVSAQTDSEARIAVPDREAQVRYVVRVLPCRTEQAQPAALLVIADIRSGPYVDRSALARVFHLSPREAEFAELFSTGLDVVEIAERMGISPNTARVHIHSVFEKTGCPSQVELSRLMAHMP